MKLTQQPGDANDSAHTGGSKDGDLFVLASKTVNTVKKTETIVSNRQNLIQKIIYKLSQGIEQEKEEDKIIQ